MRALHPGPACTRGTILHPRVLSEKEMSRVIPGRKERHPVPAEQHRRRTTRLDPVNTAGPASGAAVERDGLEVEDVLAKPLALTKPVEALRRAERR